MSQPALSTLRHPPITFHAKPQPSFNKNFDLLIRHMHEMKAAGYETYICSENQRIAFGEMATFAQTSFEK